MMFHNKYSMLCLSLKKSQTTEILYEEIITSVVTDHTNSD